MSLLGIGRIINIEPKVVTLNVPYKAIGLSVKTSMKSVFTDLPKLYKKYMSLKDKFGIPDQKVPWEYVSLSKNFDEDKTWDYFTGHVVKNTDSMPEMFISFEIPTCTYAVFPVRPRNKLMLGFTIGKMKRIIYNNWLPKSKYEFLGYEFEYNNEKMFKESPYYIDLYVAVKEKNL